MKSTDVLHSQSSEAKDRPGRPYDNNESYDGREELPATTGLVNHTPTIRPRYWDPVRDT